jgi:hypothetical protein
MKTVTNLTGLKRYPCDRLHRRRAIGGNTAVWVSASKPRASLRPAWADSANTSSNSAAGLKINRVLAIRDGGSQCGPQPYYGDAVAQTVAPEASAPFNSGLQTSDVSVRVDFALGAK